MRRAKGTIHVFTFKEGLLSRVAHDLRIRLEDFQITLDGEELRAEFVLGSLRLDGPVEGGVVHPERYDASRRAEVERAMKDDILHVGRHPRATFTGRALAKGDGYSVDGTLELAGRSAPLSFEVRKDGGEQYRARFELRPSRWGIPQYKAMLGAIRLQDVLRVEVALSDA
jgi:polyisoprenoid-binding protein YceI